MENYPFRDESLPVSERIDDLISRLTVEEKFTFFHTEQDAIERLGISAFNICAEGAHGLMHRTMPSTSFPQTIGLAASWDRNLLRRIGEVIGRQARFYHMQCGRTRYASLWFPTIDLERNPLWGRNEEGYGEDPYLAGELASEIVRGAQGDDEFYVQVSCAPKHFIANNNEEGRRTLSCSVAPRDMREYYLKPFKKVMGEAKACSVMTSYNKLNGIPMSVHPLVGDFIKKECGLDGRGHCVTDNADFLEVAGTDRYFESDAESFAEVLRTGGDVLNENRREDTINAVREAYEKGLVSEEELDAHLRNILLLRFRYGIYDRAESCPYNRFTADDIMTDADSELSRRAVRESAVLLKNDGGALPLAPESTGKIAVFGFSAERAFADWYTGVTPYEITPLDGLRARYGEDKIIFTDCRDLVSFRTLDGRPLVISGEYDALTVGKKGEKAAQFIRTDWGGGVNTFTYTETGKMLEQGFDDRPDRHISEEEIERRKAITKNFPIRAVTKTPLHWINSTQHNIIDAGGGAVFIKTWNERYLTADGSEYLSLTMPLIPSDGQKFIMETDGSWREKARNAAKNADAALVFCGNDPMFSAREETDRVTLALPEAQEELVSLVSECNKKTVMCLVSSFPYAIGEAAGKCAAVLTLAHGMQEMGHGLADIISGDFSPSGRLPQTWYSSDDELCDIMDYNIIDSRQTYLYYKGTPLYPFGHGLSYGEFEYSALELSSDSIGDGEKITVSFTVKNIGKHKAAETPQLYVSVSGSRVKRPQKALCGFEKLELEPGESARVEMLLDSGELKIWDVTSGSFVLENGVCTVMAGASSGDIRLSAKINVRGKAIPPRSFENEIFASDFDTQKNVYLGCKRGSGVPAVFFEKGGEIVFSGADISSLGGRLRVVVSTPCAGRRIKIYSGGELIADTVLPNTGVTAYHARYEKPSAGNYFQSAWTAFELPINNPGGICDLSISLSPGCGLYSISGGRK